MRVGNCIYFLWRAIMALTSIYECEVNGIVWHGCVKDEELPYKRLEMTEEQNY